MVVASKDYTAGFNDAANGLLECLKHPPGHSCIYCKVMLNLSLRAVMRVHASSDDLCKVEDKAIMTEGCEDYCRGWERGSQRSTTFIQLPSRRLLVFAL